MISASAVVRAACAVVASLSLIAWMRDGPGKSMDEERPNAVRLVEEGKFAEAAAICHRLLALDPNDRSARIGRDFCRKELGEPGFADDWFRRFTGDELFAAVSLSLALVAVSGLFHAVYRLRMLRVLIACGLLGCLLPAAIIVGAKVEQAVSPRAAIRVVGRAITLRAGNGDDYEAVADQPLFVGAEVRVEHVRGSWCRVARPNGVVGWLPTSCIIDVEAARITP